MSLLPLMSRPMSLLPLMSRPMSLLPLMSRPTSLPRSLLSCSLTTACPLTPSASA